jgi:hypothetical protein
MDCIIPAPPALCLALLRIPLVKPDQQLAHKIKCADGVLGRSAGRFKGFEVHKSFAKNNRHRLANLPFRIRKELEIYFQAY